MRKPPSKISQFVSRLKQAGREAYRRTRNVLTAGLNAAKLSADTWQHWWGVRNETPLSIVKPHDRETVNAKAVEEFLNNEVVIGFVDVFKLYVVGTGPQLRFNSNHREINKFIENKWRKWSWEIKLATILREAIQSLVVSGEAFLLISLNPHRKTCGINITVIDPIRVCNPAGMVTGRFERDRKWFSLQDGVLFDEYGNVLGYYVCREAENDTTGYDKTKCEFVPAEQLYHIYDRKVPESPRGWSWFAPDLELLGRIRDYRDCTVEAARSSAAILATIETQDGYLRSEGNELFPWSSHDMDNWRAKITELPPNTKMNAFKPEQPAGNATEFMSYLIAQAGRGVGLTRRFATGDSSQYNFTSGRLDGQPVEILFDIMQQDFLESGFLDSLIEIFYRFINESLLVRFGDEAVPDPEEIEFEWMWPIPPAFDPEGDARAAAIDLQNGQNTLRRQWMGRHGVDLDDVMAELEESRRLTPAVFGIKEEGGADGVAPSATGTRIDEPSVSVENPGGAW